MRGIVRRFSAMALTRKIMLLFVAVAVLPLLALNISLYRQSISQHISSVQESEGRLLESNIAGVRERMGQIEHVMETISTSSPIIHLLTADYANSRAQMIFDLEHVYTQDLANLGASLKNTGVYITLYMARDDVPEKYYGVLRETRLHGAWFDAFLASDLIGRWGGTQPMYPSEISIYTSGTPQVLPYFRKIIRGRGEHLGTVMAGARPERLMQSLALAPDEGALAVYLDGQVIYATGDGDMAARITLDAQHLQQLDGLLYLRMPIADTGMQVLRVLDFGALRTQAMQGSLVSLVAWFLVGGMFLLLSTLLLRLTMRRLGRVTQRIAHAQDNQLLEPLPVDGNDEIAQLAEAFNALILRIERQMGELLSQEQAKRRAQILALQYQLNPHFLFNALLWLQMSLEEREDHALSDAVASLGTLLRYNLSDKAFAQLGEEVAHLGLYVDFANMWKRNSFDLSMDWPKALETWELPRFTLQPLVENAMQHGLIWGQVLRIRVTVEQVGGCVVCTVQNDGKTISPERLAEIEASLEEALPDEGQPRGIGLLNLAHRLRLLYGEGASLRIGSADGWTRCVVTIPER